MGKKRCNQVQTVLQKDELMTEFIKSSLVFQEHVQKVNSYMQYSEMRNLREILKDGEVLVWMDFAENFNCSSLEEVQSAYWNSEMVTLHTQVIYFPRSQCFQFKYSRSVECSLSQRNCYNIDAQEIDFVI